MDVNGLTSNKYQAQNESASYVSCTLASTSSETDDLSVMMCQTEFSSEKCATLQDFEKLLILKLLASEGSDIIIAEKVDISQLKCFAGAPLLESWYELVVLLSGEHFESVEVDRKWAQGKRWRFYFVAPASWNLVFETQFESFTQRHCELALTPAPADQELDLFHLSLKLFEAQCHANTQIHALESKCRLLETEIQQNLTEKKEWEDQLRARDEKTRSVIIALLNEKKSMIHNLQERLELNKGPLDLPDHALMNQFINQPVSRMTSPRKRSQALGSAASSPKKKVKRQPVKREVSWDDFSDKGFEIRGINRERTPNSTSSTESSDVKSKARDSAEKSDSKTQNLVELSTNKESGVFYAKNSVSGRIRKETDKLLHTLIFPAHAEETLEMTEGKLPNLNNSPAHVESAGYEAHSPVESPNKSRTDFYSGSESEEETDVETEVE
ncbi:LAME_0C08724g1_1 [Lachancea meyersii CBS 8951]|uniref:LAME_0C08724g1_1 n=1 Tax=Lachancea meyersii CBS 8951 TaxID=1266667 RepID=A0A1G4J3D2_9SACH|nr:LAME_0C08724g1_1 [Lachancea meyersii CBS 8951]